MGSLAAVATWAGSVLLGGLVAVVLLNLFNGTISLDQLLEGDVRDSAAPGGFSTQPSNGRAQALAVTLFCAGYYLMTALQQPGELPAPPDWLLAATAGSQTIYLGGKARAMLLG